MIYVNLMNFMRNRLHRMLFPNDYVSNAICMKSRYANDCIRIVALLR